MQNFGDTLKQIAKELFNCDVEPVVGRPDEQFGDYSTNIAMQLAGKLNKNPREIAELIKEQVVSLEGVASVEVAGPGFINVFLSEQALIDLAVAPLTKILAGKQVVAEYSDPNPFKTLHAGHLYTSLVGDSVANLLETAGANVHRVNFGGDVGRHVGIAMWAILRELGGENPEKLHDVPEHTRLDWISQQYVKGTSAFEEDEAAKAEITELNKRVYALHESGDRDTPFAQIYWTCRQWSYDGFNALYNELGMTPFEKYYPESATTPYGMKLVEQGLKDGIFVESDGAVVYEGEKHGLHTRVFRTSIGLPTYEAKDLGLAENKWLDYSFDLSVMITGNDIVEYMKVVLSALSHFHPEIAERTRHLTHGMIKLAGGIKMSSRKGNILRASDVIEAAREANKSARGQEDDAVAIGAIKYAFLKQRIGADIIYDPEESVALQGNSGPYIQYAHARARSILAKAPAAGSLGATGTLTVEERSLLRKLGEFNETVLATVAELMPHNICTYLYELAHTFNAFYEKSRVIGDEREAFRLGLVSKYADTLKEGLRLLGIAAPDHM